MHILIFFTFKLSISLSPVSELQLYRLIVYRLIWLLIYRQLMIITDKVFVYLDIFWVISPPIGRPAGMTNKSQQPS